MAMEKITVKNAAKSFSVNKARNRMSSVRLAPAQPPLVQVGKGANKKGPKR